MSKEIQKTDTTASDKALPSSTGSDFAVFEYVEQPLGEPLLAQMTYWLPLERALSRAESDGGFVLSRFISNSPVLTQSEAES